VRCRDLQHGLGVIGERFSRIFLHRPASSSYNSAINVFYYFLMVTLFRCLSVLPLWLLHALGALLGWVAYLGSGMYRARFQANAAQAGFSASQVRAAVGQAGRMVTELPRLWMGAAPHFEWQGSELVDAQYRAGKGVLFLTPHLGCFEVTAQGLAQRYSAQYGDLTVLYRPARKAWMVQLIESSRNRPGLVAVPTTLAGVKHMIKALKAGRAVGLLPDQVPPEGLGMWSPFFGRDAYTMTLSARLAQQTGAAVVLTWGERQPWGRGYRLHFSALSAPLSSDLPQAVAQINAAMEGLIRQCPAQYLWGYARYKTPLAALPSAANAKKDNV
jgi:Kdo2-lipid IVA lauroyltransferase/acyltransferase